jgi:S-DNA-T family DNA segregation ATPase FtsK/SpoIIIE
MTEIKRKILSSKDKDIIRRLSRFLFSLFVFVLGIFFAASLLTYDSNDPSFFHATDANPNNLAALPGAFLSDFLLQVFGLPAILLALTFVMWGVKMIKSPCKTSQFITHVAILPLCMVSLSGLLSSFSEHLTWSENYRNGGFLGHYLFLESEYLFGQTDFARFLATFRIVTLVFTILFFIYLFEIRIIKITLYTFSYSLKFFLKIFSEFSTKKKPAKSITKKNIPAKSKIIKKKKIKEKTPIKTSKFILPSTDLLHESKSSESFTGINAKILMDTSAHLQKVLSDYSIQGEIVGAKPGPVVTQYELKPSPGLKASRVIGLSDDIARSMHAVSARISVLSGKNLIGIELPNPKRAKVELKEMLTSSAYRGTDARIPLALGKDIAGKHIVVDLSKMPHLLIAGTTGSGKSVSINAMILSILYKLPPEECRILMIDPKMLELSIYNDIPHLLTPVVTNPKKAVIALKWVVREMEERYKKMSKINVRNIDSYNEKAKEYAKKREKFKKVIQTGFHETTGEPIHEEVIFEPDRISHIVVIVDEMADLMIVAGKEIEACVQRLAQMARASGIHLIMATQRPSVDVITGTIKANFPVRISFQVTSKIDSRTILGEQGAEQLLGQGDMLYMTGGKKISRIHSPFIADDEVETIVEYLKKAGKPQYIEDILLENTDDGEMNNILGIKNDDKYDEFYDQAVAIIAQEGKASTSFLQRKLQIGYNRAARIIEKMEEQNVITPPNHVGKREVLIHSIKEN